MPDKRMTIREIAALAGVSVSAVSKVLNISSDVGPETRKRVLELIKTHNYRRKVSSVNSRVIGVAFPGMQGNHDVSMYLSTMLTGITDFFFEKKIRVELIKEALLPREEGAFFQFCMEANLSGVIVLLSKLEDRYLGDLGTVFPVVVTANKLDTGAAVCIRYDAYGAGSKATLHLLELGHRNIGFIAEDKVHHDQVYRFRGYKETLEARGFPVPEQWVLDLQKTQLSDLAHHLDFLLRKAIAPSAFVVSNDMMALQVLDLLGNIGKSVPQDVSIVGFDDLPFARHLMPPLTTVSQPVYRMGYSAGQRLFECINRPETDPIPEDVVLDCELIIRASTKEPKRE